MRIPGFVVNGIFNCTCIYKGTRFLQIRNNLRRKASNEYHCTLTVSNNFKPCWWRTAPAATLGLCVIVFRLNGLVNDNFAVERRRGKRRNFIFT